MVRWIVFMLLTGFMGAQVTGTPAKTPEATQGEAQQQPTVAGPGAVDPSIATAGFPFDPFQEFSAVMVGSVLPGDEREGHIYRSGNLLRTQGSEGLGYFLTDLEARETYGLTTLGCTSDSHPYFRAFPFTAAKPGRKIERVAAGTESVDGHRCKVETVTVSSGDLALPIKLKFWEAEDLQGFPIKVQILSGGGRGTIQYKNVVLGPADPTLFIRPKKCGHGLPQPPKKESVPKKKAVRPAANKSHP
jgi:hypothetical protein